MGLFEHGVYTPCTKVTMANPRGRSMQVSSAKILRHGGFSSNLGDDKGNQKPMIYLRVL